MANDDAVREDRRLAIEACVTACFEQRCQRGTPWDAAVLECVAALRALAGKGEEPNAGGGVYVRQDSQCAGCGEMGHFECAHKPDCEIVTGALDE